MTETEAIKVIRNKACNDRCTEIHCDDSCMYGEGKCAFHMAIKALEKIEKIKFIINEKHYSEAEECDYGNYYNCENALMIKDIEEIINGSETCWE